MYNNLIFSIIGVLLRPADFVAVTAFVSTAANVVGELGVTVGLVARLGTCSHSYMSELRAGISYLYVYFAVWSF